MKPLLPLLWMKANYHFSLLFQSLFSNQRGREELSTTDLAKHTALYLSLGGSFVYRFGICPKTYIVNTNSVEKTSSFSD
jgi:hypothetical protein